MNVEQSQTHEREEARERAAQDLEAIRGDLRRLRGDLEKLSHSGREHGAHSVREMKTRLRQQASELEDRTTRRLRHAYLLAREQGRQTADRARSAVAGTRQRVVSHPLTSVLVTLGVGLLIGRLIRRR